jgi:MFS family permease
MTDIHDGRCDQAGQSPGQVPEQPRGGSKYLRVLRMPGALRFSSAAAVGRATMSMFVLGSLLMISARTGRYGTAGLVASAEAVSYAISSARLARLTDRLGQHRVLRPQVVVFGLATAAFVACAQAGAPMWALLLTGCLAGASMPSLGSVVRARWSALLGTSPLLGTAYALESVIDEMIFVVGPAVATLLATEVQPAAGVVTAVALCITGTLALASQRATEPPVAPAAAGRTHTEPSVAPAASAPSAASPSAAPPPAQPARRYGLPVAGLVTLTPLFGFLGAMFSSIDLSTVAFAQQHGHKPLAGLLLGTYALGSATGGIWYGSRSWHARLERRFATTLCLTVAGVATFWTLPGLRSLAVVIFFAGLTISPTLIAGFGLIERQAPAERLTEGMAWLSSSVSVGVAAGAAVAGHVVDAGGARAGYLLAACCGCAAAAVCLTGLRRLRAVSAS